MHVKEPGIMVDTNPDNTFSLMRISVVLMNCIRASLDISRGNQALDKVFPHMYITFYMKFDAFQCNVDSVFFLCILHKNKATLNGKVRDFLQIKF